MPIYLSGDQSNGPAVARTVQPVEQAIGARLGEQRRQPAGILAARFYRVMFGHGRHGAPSPWRLSSGIESESSREGGAR